MEKRRRGGQPGNRNAAKGQRIQSAIEVALAAVDDERGLPDGSTHWDIIKAWVRDALVNPQVRESYLDRRYGKPTQTVDVSTDGERRAEELSDEELIAIVVAGRSGDSEETPRAGEPDPVH